MRFFAYAQNDGIGGFSSSWGRRPKDLMF